MSTQWLQHPGVTTAIASTKAYLRASLLMDTGLTGDLVYWWEWMATLGYDPRSRMARAATTRASSPLALFLLDVRQTHDGNNFAPRVMAPPHGDVRRVVWDPYEAPTEQENTPYLLFAVALKVQCRTTYGDAFYVLRASQRANAVPLFICTRARVRRFLDEGVTTFGFGGRKRVQTVAEQRRVFTAPRKLFGRDALQVHLNGPYQGWILSRLRRPGRQNPFLAGPIPMRL